MTSFVEIVSPGWATTVQDRGRPGYAHLGVSPSGAVDPALAGLVNRLVGNDTGAAVLETCGGLTVRASGALLIASTRELTPISLSDGATHTLEPDHKRLWHYLAIRGGIDVQPVLGSRSVDTLSGLGPPPVAVSMRLPVGNQPDQLIITDVAPMGAIPVVARVSGGPRASWFASDWQTVMTDNDWTISTSNRIGVRMTGTPIEQIRRDELPSEGLVRGAIQMPPDGQLVMMLADHPTTGGYPVIAVVHPDDVAIVAQQIPGSSVRFRLIGE